MGPAAGLLVLWVGLNRLVPSQQPFAETLNHDSLGRIPDCQVVAERQLRPAIIYLSTIVYHLQFLRVSMFPRRV